MGTSTAEAGNGSAAIGEDNVVEDGGERDELQDSSRRSSSIAEVGVRVIPHQARHRHRHDLAITRQSLGTWGDGIENVVRGGLAAKSQLGVMSTSTSSSWACRRAASRRDRGVSTGPKWYCKLHGRRICNCCVVFFFIVCI